MTSWFAAFRATLKENEDVLDLIFNRVPAYLLVRIAAPLKITPNALTAVSFLLTCISTGFLIGGELGLAGLFIYLKVVFDCSDGQMARFTGKVSRNGRMYDELADISGQFLIFGGIGWTLMRAGFRWPVFLQMAFSLFFMGANTTIFQNFRIHYVRIYGNKAERTTPTRKAFFLAIDGLDALREATHRLVPLPDINAYARNNGLTGERFETLRAAFRKRFEPMVYVFSLAAGTSHLFAIALLALVRRLDWIAPLFILYYNAFLGFLIVIQLLNRADFKHRYMSGFNA
jgi:phosphatidylglycerophosphate synthase